MRFVRSQLRLCYIADMPLTDGGNLVSHCEEMLDAGVTSIFLRFRGRPVTSAEQEDVRRVVTLCRKKGSYCFIFDDTLLALTVGADGVYYSKLPKSVNRVREVLGVERFIGVMVSSSADASRLAASTSFEFVDFFGVGPVLQFGEKKSDCIGVDGARQVTSKLCGRPVFWIGGIRQDNILSFGENFADGVGAVRALLQSDVRESASRFLDILSDVLGPANSGLAFGEGVQFASSSAQKLSTGSFSASS